MQDGCTRVEGGERRAGIYMTCRGLAFVYLLIVDLVVHLSRGAKHRQQGQHIGISTVLFAQHGGATLFETAASPSPPCDAEATCEATTPDVFFEQNPLDVIMTESADKMLHAVFA